MAYASAVPTLITAVFATLAVTGVAAITVKVELTAQRFEGLRKSLTRLGVAAVQPAQGPRADNSWLSSVVRSFDD